MDLNSNTSCIFCQIASGKLPARILYQDDEVTAFQDIHPITPIHILVIPNRHINSVNDASAEDINTLGKLITTAGVLAKEQKINESGYRLMINTGKDAGQSVYHLHLHLLGGRRMQLP